MFVDPCFDYAKVNDEAFTLYPEFAALAPDRINYNYCAEPRFVCDAKVTLFSAGSEVEISPSDSLELQLSNRIINLYLNKKHNLINTVMDIKQLQEIVMTGSHNSWIKTPDDLIKMSEIMNTI